MKIFRLPIKFTKRVRSRFTLQNTIIAGIVVFVGIVAVHDIMQTQPMIHPAAYTPLLSTIADVESKGNYNAYFGNAQNQEVRFTDKSVTDVLKWQTQYVQEGNPSSAVGRYQIIQPTLEDLVKELNIDLNDRFDESLQDKLAIRLLERRGAVDFVNNSLSAEGFAHNLSKEWAALPKVIGESPEASYYEGDGLNKSLVKSESVLAAVEQFKQRAHNEN